MHRKTWATICTLLLITAGLGVTATVVAQQDNPDVGDLDPIVYSSADDYLAHINSLTGGEDWQESANRPSQPSVDPSYELVAVGTDSNTLTVRNESDGSTAWTYSGYDGDRVTSVNWGPNGEYLAVGTSDSFGNGGQVIVLNRTGSEVWTSQTHDGNADVRAVRIDAMGEHVYSGATDNIIAKHNLTSGAIEWNHSFGSVHGSPYSIAPGPSGDVVTFGTGTFEETSLRQLDASDGTAQWTKDEYEYTVAGVHHSGNGRIYYVSSMDQDADLYNFIGAVDEDGNDIWRTNLTDMGVSGRYTSGSGLSPLRSGGYAFGMQDKIVTWHDNGTSAVLRQELTQGISGFTNVPSQSVEGTLSLRLNAPGYMQLNASEGYTVDLVETDQATGDSTSYEVTNDSSTSVVSANVSVLSVNEDAHLLNSSGTAADVNVTATYTGGLMDTQEVAVATSICGLGPLQRATTILDDWEFVSLIIIVLPSIVLSRAVGALPGLACVVLGMAVGWFTGFVGLPLFMLTIVASLFFGLNIGENMNYQGAVRENRR